MTEAQAVEAISETFVSGWATASSGVELVLDNEAMPDATTFAAMSFRFSTAEQVTMGPAGNRRVQRNGHVFVKIWTPANVGGRQAFSTLADAARSVLELQSVYASGQVEPVTFMAATTKGEGTEGTWFFGTVDFPFYFFTSNV